METIVKFLGRAALFSDLPGEVLANLAATMETRVLEKDEMLFRQGTHGDSLFIVTKGSVKVFVDNEVGEEPWSIQYGPGSLIGEMAIIEQKPRSANVAALDSSELLELKREDFLTLLQDQPILAMGIMRSLAARLRFASICLTKSIEWSRSIAAGKYNFAIKQITSAKSQIPGIAPPESAKAEKFLSYFCNMVEGVKQREDSLKQAVHRLRIEVDERKRLRHVSEITDTDFFRMLKQNFSKHSRGANATRAFIMNPLDVCVDQRAEQPNEHGAPGA